MKTAIYCRVSKENEEMQNPANQLLPLRKFAEAMDWKVTGVFIDHASGGNSNRPEFQKMMAKVRQRHFDVILVWALDRFSREGMSNTLGYIETLKKYKTGLKSLQESWLDTTQEGVSELLLAIFAWIAKEERRKISERTKAALARLKKQGKKLGRPLKNETVKVNKIKYKLWEFANQNDSIRAIAKKFEISRYQARRVVQEGVKKGQVKNNRYAL